MMRQMRRSMDGKAKHLANGMQNIAIHFSADPSRIVGGQGESNVKLKNGI